MHPALGSSGGTLRTLPRDVSSTRSRILLGAPGCSLKMLRNHPNLQRVISTLSAGIRQQKLWESTQRLLLGGGQPRTRLCCCRRGPGPLPLPSCAPAPTAARGRGGGAQPQGWVSSALGAHRGRIWGMGDHPALPPCLRHPWGEAFLPVLRGLVPKFWGSAGEEPLGSQGSGVCRVACRRCGGTA